MDAELLKGLNAEQIAKLKACKNQEEMLALAKEEGIELTDEQLKAVSGGCTAPGHCPRCGCNAFTLKISEPCDVGESTFSQSFKECNSCGYRWDYQPL